MNDAGRPPRPQVVIGIATIALALAMLFGVVAVCGLLRPGHPGPHSPRSSLTSLDSQLTVSVDQPYVDNGRWKACRKAFAEAMLPQPPVTALAAFGMVAAVVAVAGWRTPRVVPAGRDPPRGLAPFRTGQDLLTRFCLARR